MSAAVSQSAIPAPAIGVAARTWVEVSLAALRHNWAYVRRQVTPAAGLCAVVKADAYGHGAPRCAQALAEAGAEWLAVTSAAEGVKLREAGLRARVLVLAGFEREEGATLIEHRLTPTLWDVEQVRWLAQALQSAPGARCAVHLKLDTGMGRLGATAAQMPEVLQALEAAPGLTLEAVCSHLAGAEASDASASLEQLARLRQMAAKLVRPWHLYNSEGGLRFARTEAEAGMLVRSGLALYGYSAQPDHAEALQPALTWKARVVSVKQLPAGHGVGYGAEATRFHAARPMRVATLAVGYADGYRRSFSPGGHVLVRGIEAPLVGAVSMDLTTVDVTGIEPAPALGDEVLLLGPGLGADELARWAATLPYEILCGISARVERHYRS
ncbi:MAG: alanine racemase [Terriglobales bacterium]